jgi:hypothetical protein
MGRGHSTLENAMTVNRRTFLASSLALAVGAALPGGAFAGGGPECVNRGTRLMVHEWGTFTVLQDESGKPIGGINTDDELLPRFVHDIACLNGQARHELPPALFMKGIPRNHPDVIVRLETPVTYFYPPAGWDKPIDVTVTMPQGLLTQFYPRATPGGPDINRDGRLRRIGPIGPQSNGSLTWRGLRLGGMEPGPETTERTWLAPREVRSASVHTPDGQRERYLFYRGVGNVAAPLRVSRADETTLQLRTDWPLKTGSRIGPMLLIDARPDGKCAFRAIDAVPATAGDTSVRASFPATFSQADYAADHLAKVRAFLHQLLLRDGMLNEEAAAMLNTWEVSYFRRPGLRLFFPVPRPWTEHALPLAISESADITRAMIGRIEIVTPRQRAGLAMIAKGPASTSEWTGSALAQERLDTIKRDGATLQAVAEGRRFSLDDRPDVPADYRAYLALGRFRNALILDELHRRPTAALGAFVKNYQLEAYRLEAE